MGNAASSMAVILSIKGAANDDHGEGSRGRWAELIRLRLLWHLYRHFGFDAESCRRPVELLNSHLQH